MEKKIESMSRLQPLQLINKGTWRKTFLNCILILQYGDGEWYNQGSQIISFPAVFFYSTAYVCISQLNWKMHTIY